jgi:hypothetical protein
MTYTQINWSSISTIGGILGAANTNTGGWFWAGMLYMIYFVLMILFINWGFETALMVSAFISLTIGISLLYLGLVSLSWGILPFIGIILFTIIYIVWGTNRDSY